MSLHVSHHLYMPSRHAMSCRAMSCLAQEPFHQLIHLTSSALHSLSSTPHFIPFPFSPYTLALPLLHPALPDMLHTSLPRC